MTKQKTTANIELEANDIIQTLVSAWDALEGNRSYSQREIQRWIMDDLAPAFNLAQLYLNNIKD